MTSRDFCYWLQGFFELTGKAALTEDQAECVQKHLNMVFFHEIDPSFPDQERLNQIHETGKTISETPSVSGVNLTDLKSSVYRC